MYRNYGGVCGDTATDPSADWLERFRRERRKRRSIEYCYKGIPPLEAAGYQSMAEPLPVPEDAMAEPNNVHDNHNHKPVQSAEALPRTASSAQDFHRDKLLSGIFRDGNAATTSNGDMCANMNGMTVNQPGLRSAPLLLVFSSLYAVVLHVVFMATSWWLVHAYI
ncbi:unnamed protein product, partial [Ixodes hexagonus]